LNNQRKIYEGIVARISEGSILIETREEYENLLNLFPERASLHRAYGDFLILQNDPENAIKAYDQAADVYIDSGRTLQAIVAKILAWSIVKPTHQQGRLFHAAVRDAISSESPLQNFFADLTYPELIAVMLRLTRIRIPANHAVKNFGESGDEIYFVVSGKIKETTYLSSKDEESDLQASVRQLADNDIFGDAFPLDRENTARSDVESLSHAELVKIEKNVLKQLCRKHPRIELWLANLYKDPGEAHDGRSWVSVRRTVRHEIPINVQVTLYRSDDDPHPVVIEGFTKDISLGGACIDLGEKHWSAPMESLNDTEVTVEISLPNANITMELEGTIVWSTKIMENGSMNILAGVKFKPLDDTDKETLIEYCFGSDAEQNLLWNLWEHYLT